MGFEPAEATSTKRRAIVVEDEALIRMDIVETLREGGYDVVVLAGKFKPDVVVMDAKMPVMDGITAGEHVAKERLAPVVPLSAFSQTGLVERRGTPVPWSAGSASSGPRFAHARRRNQMCGPPQLLLRVDTSWRRA